MLIHRLRLSNFRQHENTDLEFGPGLTGIIGPNGAGKTTILEALTWAMYGMPAARGSRETIRRRGAPPRARVEVELEFTLGPHHYRIVRSLHNAELYQDGDPAPIANSIGAVTERVIRLLSMSRDEFFNTYFTGQKDLAVMARMSAPERAQFLSRVLGYERIREAQDRLKERRAVLRARVETLRAGLADLPELDAADASAKSRLAAARKIEAAAAKGFTRAEAKLAEVHPRWEQTQRLRETAVALETEIRVATAQALAAGERVERLTREMAEAKEAARLLEEVARVLAPLPSLREEADVLGRQADSWRLRQGLLRQQQEVRTSLASVEERLSGLAAPTVRDTVNVRVADLRESLAVVLAEAEAIRTTWVRDAQDAQTKRQALVVQYQELKEQRDLIVAAGPDGICPTCARPLGAEYPAMLQLLDGQMEQVVGNGNFYKQRIEQLQQEPKELAALEQRRVKMERELSEATSELGRLNAQAQETERLREDRERLTGRIEELQSSLDPLRAEYDAARHEAVLKEIRELEPIALQAERLRAVVDRTASLAGDLQSAGGERDQAAAVVARLTADLKALGYSEKTYRELRDAEEGAQRSRREAELALVRARSETSAATEAVEAVARRRAERSAREREIAAAAGDLELHQELDRAFTDLRTDLNAGLRPDLSDLASGFLRDLTHGRYTDLELDDDYCATVIDEGDAKAVISGGEEDIVNLALRLAISQMIAERAGQPLSLLILDEIFGSLDDVRRVAVADLLHALTDRFPQVILVTHVEPVGREFDRVVRVGYDAMHGVSTVNDEPPGGEDVAA
jgi:exonuclease SbcC